MKTPYDGRFKLLAEEFPNLLLRGSSAEPIDILRELHLDHVQVDHVYRIGRRIVHFEAITSWHAARVPKLALYRFLMKQKFQSDTPRKAGGLMSWAASKAVDLWF